MNIRYTERRSLRSDQVTRQLERRQPLFTSAFKYVVSVSGARWCCCPRAALGPSLSLALQVVCSGLWEGRWLRGLVLSCLPGCRSFFSLCWIYILSVRCFLFFCFSTPFVLFCFTFLIFLSVCLPACLTQSLTHSVAVYLPPSRFPCISRNLSIKPFEVLICVCFRMAGWWSVFSSIFKSNL